MNYLTLEQPLVRYCYLLRLCGTVLCNILQYKLLIIYTVGYKLRRGHAYLHLSVRLYFKFEFEASIIMGFVGDASVNVKLTLA